MTATLAPAPTWQHAPTTLPERFALEVEWVDIREGITCSAHLCPIAHALNRWLFDHGISAVSVTVGHNDVVVDLDWHQPSIRYFHTGRSWVERYDKGRSVEPETISFVREPKR